MTDVTALLARHGVRTNKSLGQNFLHRQDIIEDIAESAAGGKYALEIGAGPALLTRELCKRFERVVTVEIDRSLSPVSDEVLRDITNHRMVYADFLKCDITGFFDHCTVVGNLPYNLTGDIITKLLKNHARFDKAVVMIQKEAAEKLTALPGTKGYRAISALCGYFCDMRPLFDVSPDCFVPAPHVTSTVMELRFKTALPLPPQAESGFYMFVHRLFSQRRKLITSIFQSPEDKARVREVLESLGLSSDTRAERLRPDQMCTLYKNLYCEQM